MSVAPASTRVFPSARWILAGLLLMVALLAISGFAHAAHSRGGTISWEKDSAGDIVVHAETFGVRDIDPTINVDGTSYGATTTLIGSNDEDLWAWVSAQVTIANSTAAMRDMSFSVNCRFVSQENVEYMGNGGCPTTLTKGTINPMSEGGPRWVQYQPHVKCTWKTTCWIPLKAEDPAGRHVQYGMGIPGTHVEKGFEPPERVVWRNTAPIMHSNGTIEWDLAGVATAERLENRTFYSLSVIAYTPEERSKRDETPLEFMIEIVRPLSTVDYWYSPHICARVPAYFMDTSEGEAPRWTQHVWDFGFSPEPEEKWQTEWHQSNHLEGYFPESNVRHEVVTFPRPGTYPVTLTVGGMWDRAIDKSLTRSITVEDCEPEAVFKAPAEVCTRVSISVPDLSFTKGTNVTLRDSWISWGDGNIDGLWPWVEGHVYTHQYGRPGTFTIELNVENSVGLLASTTQEIEVLQAKPQPFDLSVDTFIEMGMAGTQEDFPVLSWSSAEDEGPCKVDYDIRGVRYLKKDGDFVREETIPVHPLNIPPSRSISSWLGTQYEENRTWDIRREGYDIHECNHYSFQVVAYASSWHSDGVWSNRVFVFDHPDPLRCRTWWRTGIDSPTIIREPSAVSTTIEADADFWSTRFVHSIAVDERAGDIYAAGRGVRLATPVDEEYAFVLGITSDGEAIDFYREFDRPYMDWATQVLYVDEWERIVVVGKMRAYDPPPGTTATAPIPSNLFVAVLDPNEDEPDMFTLFREYYQADPAIAYDPASDSLVVVSKTMPLAGDPQLSIWRVGPDLAYLDRPLIPIPFSTFGPDIQIEVDTSTSGDASSFVLTIGGVLTRLSADLRNIHWVPTPFLVNDVAVSPRGDVHVIGTALSAGPLRNAWQVPMGTGTTDAYYAWFDRNGTVEILSPMGDIYTDAGVALALNDQANQVILGVTMHAVPNNPQAPLRASHLQNYFKGEGTGISEMLVTVLDLNSKSITYSTLVGGVTTGSSLADVAISATGHLYVAGTLDGPGIPGAASPAGVVERSQIQYLGSLPVYDGGLRHP